jgi:hypothetical protein
MGNARVKYLELRMQKKGFNIIANQISITLFLSIMISFLTIYLAYYNDDDYIERFWFILAPTTVSCVLGSLTQILLGLSDLFQKTFAFIYSIPIWYIPISLFMSLKYPAKKKSLIINTAICIIIWIAPIILHMIAQSAI